MEDNVSKTVDSINDTIGALKTFSSTSTRLTEAIADNNEERPLIVRNAAAQPTVIPIQSSNADLAATGHGPQSEHTCKL